MAPVLAGLVVAGCQPSRTEVPAGIEAAAATSAVTAATTVTTAAAPVAPPTTASAFKSPGEKHPLAGGTLAASYPRVGVRPPKGVAPPPAGQAWAVVNVRFCAAETLIDSALVDPARFRVEVPGQGEVAPAAGAPALSKTPLQAGTAGVPPGSCVEGSVIYLVAGEGHIEAVTYDTGAGLLRWAT